ncbi:MAG: protoporphyrinogen oxidase [Gammaproteobacteria bacterium]|nr:protoporphyrinogen oxidase [Gammaproteobacteria bacterium]
MKRIVFYFLVLLLAVWLGITMHRNPGYVLIAYNNISVETSLWFATIALIFLFLVFYFFLRFSSGVIALTSYIKQWIGGRRKRRAHAQTVLGLYDLIEGNWEHAEKKLLRASKYSDMPLVNYLASAFMAQNQHAFKRRDGYLRLAQSVAKDRPVVVGLAQASLQIGNKQWEEASATLQSIGQLQPKNVYVLQLLQRVYLELKDWRGLEKILPSLRKRRVIGFEAINKLEEKVYKELLLIGLKNHTIETVWDNLPKYLHKDSELAAVYVEYLLANKREEEAENILKMALHKALSERLLELYALLTSEDPIKQLARAERWLKTKPENAKLLLCLGQICRKQKLWGKAIHYLEKSALIAPDLTVYAELGQIMAKQDDPKSALAFYEKGVSLYRTKS